MPLNKPTFSAQLQGRSFILNAVFCCLNIAAFTGILLAFLQTDNLSAILYGSISGLIFVFTVFAIIVLKGRRLFATISSVFLGVILLVSGFVKLNDPIGFSYKLEEYFQDGALAYRVRDIIGVSSFSLESFVPFAIWIGFILCALEITCGVLLLIRANLQKTIYTVFLMLFFFLFLTGHTATCDAGDTYLEKKVLLKESESSDILIQEAKKNKLAKVTEEKGNICISTPKHVQCVSDCGCFGDALKASIGRSLTPVESFLKDIFLLYLALWVFLARRRIIPNDKDQNSRMLLALLPLTLPFALLFQWYALLILLPTYSIIGLWCVRNVKLDRKSYLWTKIAVVAACFVFFLGSWTFGPFKDFSPYAKGSNLGWKMSDGSSGKFESLVVYKNLDTGEQREYDANSVEYANSQIWEKEDWQFVKMRQKELEAPRLASITEQFDPVASVDDLEGNEYLESGIKQLLRLAKEQKKEEISIRSYIRKVKKVVMIVVRDVVASDWGKMDRLKQLSEKCKRKNIPFLVITNSSKNQIRQFQQKWNWGVPFFQNDDTELKVISRLSPAVLILERGIVLEKYTYRSLPEIDRIEGL